MERRDTTINDKLYSILVPPVRQAMPLCTRVAVLLGPLLGSLGADIQSGGWAKFAQAIQSVDPVKADALLMDAVNVTKLSCEGNCIADAIGFEKHFSQYRQDTYQVMIWCLWESVKDFFPQLGAFTQIAKKAAEGGFQFPTGGASTGG